VFDIKDAIINHQEIRVARRQNGRLDIIRDGLRETFIEEKFSY